MEGGQDGAMQRAVPTAYDQGLSLSAAGRHLEAIARFETALFEKPDDSRALFALGNTARALGMAEAAEQFFRQVLALEPARLEALVNLANLLRARGQFGAAISLLEPALAPDSPELHLTLGSALRESGDADGAMDAYRRALAIRPDFVPALVNLADMLCDGGAPGEARSLYDRAIALEPKNAQARLNRAILHFLSGDLKAGWRDYAARLEIPGKIAPTALKLPLWGGENLKGKRLLVRAEQGVGDQILFASLFADLIARAAQERGSVILECEPRLVPLLARSFPGAAVRPAVMTGGKADYGWLKAAGGANLTIAMGSLPRILRPRIETFPTSHAFLLSDAEEAARWKAVFGPGAVGICWRSGKAGGHRAAQYAPLEAWGEFLRGLSGTIVSVQYDAQPEEIAALEQISGRPIVVPAGIDQKQELDRAAALLAALEAVVTAPTAVAWLAAGSGTRTLKLLYDTSWTALGQPHEPFAPSCVCVMPETPGCWRETFAKAKALIARP
jgi:tetratricopeptide (TPR) repeat protein